MKELQYKYETLSKWIGNADTKAQILLGIQLFILGYVLNSGFPKNWHSVWDVVVIFSFLYTSCFALFYLYRIIRPRLTNNLGNSLIYFQDLAKLARSNHKSLKDNLMNERPESFSEDLANQVIALAKVCDEKYKDLKEAESFMVVSFILGLALSFMS